MKRFAVLLLWCVIFFREGRPTKVIIFQKKDNAINYCLGAHTEPGFCTWLPVSPKPKS